MLNAAQHGKRSRDAKVWNIAETEDVICLKSADSITALQTQTLNVTIDKSAKVNETKKRNPEKKNCIVFNEKSWLHWTDLKESYKKWLLRYVSCKD